jgi:hypothetical protein
MTGAARMGKAVSAYSVLVVKPEGNQIDFFPFCEMLLFRLHVHITLPIINTGI